MRATFNYEVYQLSGREDGYFDTLRNIFDSEEEL